MKYCFFSLLLSLLINAPAAAADTTRVLFIGNSFTYVNMVPDLVKGIAQEAGWYLEYAMHAPGGATVGDSVQGSYAHMENPAVYDLIRQGNWNYVVLQDNQGRFVYDYGVFKPSARTIEGHKRIMDSTLHYNPCAAMVWFCGWAFKDGSPPYGNTGIEMIDRIDANYKFMNDSLQQIIAPIGAAWKRSILAQPDVDLWDADGAHASLQGSYLTAAVLFSTLFKRDPSLLDFNGGLPAPQAALFRQRAYATVRDSFTVNNEPAFTLPLTYSGGALVTAPGYSLYEYYKNGVKVASIPAATYTTPPEGCYQVTARSAGGCLYRSAEFCPEPTAISYRGAANYSLRVYPNPAKDELRLSLDKPGTPAEISVYTPEGRLVISQVSRQQEARLDISRLSPGLYLLRCQAGASFRSLIFCKE